MGYLDIGVFVAFIAAVISLGLWRSTGEETHGEQGAQNYFLAGRKLTWWLVGFSLIAANISTEQFVGMSGQAADWLGMAIASYEWIAAITLVVVAFVFLPTFLRSGIYTIPEFLEYRYSPFARLIMAVVALVTLVGVPTASVIYSGAKVITGNFQGVTRLGIDLGDITVGCYIIGTLAAVYVFAGGLKACAWADLLQGSALIVGGGVIAAFAMSHLAQADPAELIKTRRNEEVTVERLAESGSVCRFWDLNKGPLPEGKTHMVRPRGDQKIPWTALVIGLWIPNFFYWGLNQYITQRTLGSKSLAEGQKGIVFAAFLKLIIPFIVVIPGILAFNLFDSDLKQDAVRRNALILSEKSPDLYLALSEGVKPEPTVARFRTDLERIERNLSAPRAPSPTVTFYEFGDVFAALHPADAELISRFNREQLMALFPLPASPPDDAAVLEWAHYFSELSQSSRRYGKLGSSELSKSVVVEQLMAHDYDNAFPTLIRRLVPQGSGIKGFVLASIFGAVVSTLASMLNSASTIATMDIFRKVHPGASPYTLVTVGRVCVVLFVLIAMFIAPSLGHPRFGGIFNFIQEFQGFISPGILAVFLFGLLVPRAPRVAGTAGLILSPVLYGVLYFWFSWIAFLDRMAISFFAIVFVLAIMTWRWPLKRAISLPENPEMNMETSRGAMAFGVIVVCLTLALYIVFW